LNLNYSGDDLKKWRFNGRGVESVLTQKEQKIIREKNISFYTIWTLKEAHLKATGSGLSTPLHEIEFLSIEESSIFKRGEYYYKTQQIEDGISIYTDNLSIGFVDISLWISLF
jgi:phosphopantetheinyl transferase